MTRMIFVSLPVNDLNASIRFYEAIGCTKNPQFSDDNSAAMVWSETIHFMLLNHASYSTFVSKPIGDAHATSPMLIALTLDSREEVDAIIEAAAANGGKADIRPVSDVSFMYQRTFEDPDGNGFEPLWMNPEATFGAPEA
jgi:uncharacterized protein